MIQYSTAIRNGMLDQFESVIGVSSRFRAYSGAIPANPAAGIGAAVLLIEIVCPSDWMSAASAGVKSLAGSWTGTAAASGTPTFARLWDSAGTTCGFQGNAGIPVTIATSVLSAANSNVLTFTATTGVAVGQVVSGTGIVAGSTVLAFTATTVTLSLASTAGVAAAASIKFGFDVEFNGTITSGQTVTQSTFALQEGNA